MKRRTRAICALLLLFVVTACHPMDDEYGGEHDIDYYIVGDSTVDILGLLMSLEAGIGAAGCSYSTLAVCQIPVWDVPIDLDGKLYVVAFASIHDARLGCVENSPGFFDCSAGSSAYATAHATLSAPGLPVIWVEVPPVFESPGHPYNPMAAQLNVEIAATLGCSLVPWSIREAPTIDGIHYNEDGIHEVVLNLTTLNASDAC